MTKDTAEPPGRFAGSTALVAGASSGIGAAIARRLARDGAVVHVCARRRERLLELAQEVSIDASGSGRTGRIVAHAADLASPSDVETLFADLAREGATLDFVVNAAAVLWLGPFADQPEEHWQRMLDVNLAGAARLLQHALRAMRESGRGQILQITSTTATIAVPQLAIYSTTKAALSHLLKALRGEHGASAIRLTELEIGNTRGTEGGGSAMRKTPPAAVESLMKWTGLPETMAIDDVVDAVVWALSTPDHVRLDKITIRERGSIPV